jgi:hypothetical protein
MKQHNAHQNGLTKALPLMLILTVVGTNWALFSRLPSGRFLHGHFFRGVCLLALGTLLLVIASG